MVEGIAFAGFYLHKISVLVTAKRSALFFFFPTSLAALFLLLLACNGFFTIFSVHVPFPAKTQHLWPENSRTRSSSSSSSSSLMLAVKEETPFLQTTQRLQLLEQSDLLSAPINTTVSNRLRWFRKHRSKFRFLNSTPLSKKFSARTRRFFLLHKCKLRFFMTWISSLESFSNREIFAIQSVFKSHPNACLLILSNTMDSKQGRILLKPFLKRGFRVNSVSPDLPFIFKNTFAEPWFDQLRKGNIDPGEVSLGQNLSNLLRLAVLYKFGGIYMDTDVIVLKSLSSLRNSIGAQTSDSETGKWSRLNNAVMVFDKKHPLLEKFIEEFALTFNGNRWGHNGPYLVSRVASRVVDSPGFKFTVLPPMAFYPVDWSRIPSLFHRPRDGNHSRWVSAKLGQIQKESFTVHLWNRQSRSIRVEEGSIISHVVSACCIFCNSSSSSIL